MVVFGFLLMTQFRVHQAVPFDPSGLRADELTRLLKATEERLVAAERERDHLVAELARQAVPVAPTPPRDVTPLELLAGTIAVHGPGLVIDLTEATDATTRARINDEDLWLVTNELLAAGAEGLSINGLRIVSISGIRNVGQRIMIHQNMTAAPFEIVAIGDPAVMEAALRMRGGVVDALDRWGIRTKINRHDSIRLPAFTDTPTFRHLKPVR